MSSMSVNRCIAVAAHGRRCQQTTYRGGPYCWHHTQSRKVWAPSRVSSRRRQPPAADAAAVPAPEITAVPPVAAPPSERIAAALTPEQAEVLADFLERGEGSLVIERTAGDVVLDPGDDPLRLADSAA